MSSAADDALYSDNDASPAIGDDLKPATAAEHQFAEGLILLFGFDLKEGEITTCYRFSRES
jgi:hypothetical protein